MVLFYWKPKPLFVPSQFSCLLFRIMINCIKLHGIQGQVAVNRSVFALGLLGETSPTSSLLSSHLNLCIHNPKMFSRCQHTYDQLSKLPLNSILNSMPSKNIYVRCGDYFMALNPFTERIRIKWYIPIRHINLPWYFRLIVS